MREPFKRAAKVTLSIRKPKIGDDMRALLRQRMEPIVAYFAAEVAELAVRRFETELENLCESFEVALSAFVSEQAAPTETAKPRRATADDWAALMSGGPSEDAVRGPESSRPEVSSVQSSAEAVPEPAVAAEQGSTSPRVVYEGPLGRVTVGNTPEGRREIEEFKADPRTVHRDIKPVNVPSTPVRRSTGSRVTCSKCGVPGHNARTCRREADAADDSLAAPPDANLDTREARRAHIVARADAAKPLSRNADRPVEHRDDEPGDDNPTADERWPKSHIESNTRIAEADKHTAVAPHIRSSWGF